MHAHKSSEYKTQLFKRTQVRLKVLVIQLKSKMGQPYAESELRHVLLERSSNECKKVTVIYSFGKLNRFTGHIAVGFLPIFCSLTS